MRVLGLDTATRRASAAVWCDGKVVAERVAPRRGDHTAQVLLLVAETLGVAGCGLNHLDLVAVSGGPGSFSGLRVGVSVAKGLSLATGVPVVSVSTLEALGRTAAPWNGAICAALDAHKGEIYAAWFESQPGSWVRRSEDSLLTVGALADLLPAPCLVLGSAVDSYGEELCRRLGDRATLAGSDAYGPCAGTVAALGSERWSSVGANDAADLEPFYVRPPDAVAGAN